MSPDRPLRADAQRNRSAILCAASRVFAEEGTSVTLERIATEAGVGVGTIYRRFPSVQHLLAEVLEEKMRRFADLAEEAASRAETEPWEAFRDFIMFILEQQATDLSFSDVMLSPDAGSELFRAEIGRALRAAEILVERAQAAGVLRTDFHHSDLYVLQHANGGIVRGVQQTAPLAWMRFGELMLEAFRAPGAGELTPPPAAWTD
ncbi:TetR/AcrR family transcriptional regulator [Dietzia sp. DQ11-71]|nr:TetR/AcrR family transcriptional regulator [Dietzia sp. DQ11-71]MBB1016752.1 TetR/AcrR family transcriptional regulator [Dietzia sp. DQ11-71]